VLRQDPRFFVPNNPNFWQAVTYSLRRVVITRTDSGADTVNSSGLLGPLAGEGLANSYLPIESRTLGNTFIRYAGDMGWRVSGNLLRAYWPTITKHVLSHRGIVNQPAQPGKSLLPSACASPSSCTSR